MQQLDWNCLLKKYKTDGLNGFILIVLSLKNHFSLNCIFKSKLVYVFDSLILKFWECSNKTNMEMISN